MFSIKRPLGPTVVNEEPANEDGELLTDEEPLPPWWRSKRLVVPTIIFVMLLLFTADLYRQSAEMEELLSATEESEAAMEEYVSAVTAAHSAWQTGYSLDKDEKYREELSDAGSTSQGKLIFANEQLRDQFILPWHRNIHEARSDYLEHSVLWEQHFGDIARDPSNIGDKSGKISGTFRVAAESMEDALPPLANDDLKRRVGAIFAE